MARTDGARLILNTGEMQAFLQQVNHPDPDTLRRRDSLFEMLDRLDMTENEDGSFEMTIDLPLYTGALDHGYAESVSVSAWCEVINNYSFNHTETGPAVASSAYSVLFAA